MKIKIKGNGRRGLIRTNAEVINLAMRRLEVIKRKEDRFKEIETSTVRWHLERKTNHTLKPIDDKEERLIKASDNKLQKLMKRYEYFDEEDCANSLIEVLFIPKTYKFLDAINRWGVPSWVVLIFEILKSIIKF